MKFTICSEDNKYIDFCNKIMSIGMTEEEVCCKYIGKNADKILSKYDKLMGIDICYMLIVVQNIADSLEGEELKYFISLAGANGFWKNSCGFIIPFFVEHGDRDGTCFVEIKKSGLLEVLRDYSSRPYIDVISFDDDCKKRMTKRIDAWGSFMDTALDWLFEIRNKKDVA